LRTRKSQVARLEARGEEFVVPLVAQEGSPEQIERDLLLKELLANLSEEEQQIILCKQLGLSTAEIAERQQRTPGAVDVLFYRIKQKFRDLLAPSDATGTGPAASPATRTASASSRRPASSPEASDAPARTLPGRRRGWR
jgi:DNA-directed RNA polymerase specialized sigma24 family protein